MGYYSEVGVAMYKEDFVHLFDLASSRKEDKYTDAYNCLEHCDQYYTDIWKEMRMDVDDNYKWKPTGKELEIVIMHWNFIKMYCIGMEVILDFVREKGDGAIGWSGEEWEDVGFESYDERDTGIEWYEYMEPQSGINIGSNSPCSFKDIKKEVDNA